MAKKHLNREYHGMAHSPEYRVWAAMKSRCNNPNHSRYRYYGGRGIKICDRWNQSFKAFFSDMGKKTNPKHTLDRINNNGNYKPQNCRWATQAQQRRNFSGNRMLTFKGKTQCMADWAKEFNLRQSQLKWHIDYKKNKVPIEELFRTLSKTHGQGLGKNDKYTRSP